MTRIAFIGLGNMGGGMAANQAKAGHQVRAYDLSAEAIQRAVSAGCIAAATVRDAVMDAEVVLTMLPAGQHVRSVYETDILPHVAKGALLIDCSTIDVDSARAVAATAPSLSQSSGSIACRLAQAWISWAAIGFGPKPLLLRPSAHHVRHANVNRALRARRVKPWWLMKRWSPNRLLSATKPLPAKLLQHQP